MASGQRFVIDGYRLVVSVFGGQGQLLEGCSGGVPVFLVLVHAVHNPRSFFKVKFVNPRTYLLPGPLAEGKVDQETTVFDQVCNVYLTTIKLSVSISITSVLFRKQDLQFPLSIN